MTDFGLKLKREDDLTAPQRVYRWESGRAHASRAGTILLLLASMARWNCTAEAAHCDSMKREHTSGLTTFVSVSPIRGSSKCHMGAATAYAAAILSTYSIVIEHLAKEERIQK